MMPMAAARPSSVSVAISYVLPVVGWRHVCPLSARQRRRKNSVYSKVKRQKAALNRKRRVYNCHAKPAVRECQISHLLPKRQKQFFYRMLTPDFQSRKWFSPYRRTQCKMRAIVTDVVAWSVRPLQKRMNRSREVMQLTRTSPKHVLDGSELPTRTYTLGYKTWYP